MAEKQPPLKMKGAGKIAAATGISVVTDKLNARKAESSRPSIAMPTARRRGSEVGLFVRP